jgi:Holliday junction DNA helicase RuvB
MRPIGNEDTLEQISIALRSAIAENRPLPHMLMSGAAGCGKTSTARYIAELTGTNFLSIACDSIKNRTDVIPIAKQLDKTGYDKHGRKVKGSCTRPSIVFIDEIHQLSLSGQEHLGILMEEWHVPINGQEAIKLQSVPASKLSELDYFTIGLKYWAPEFTLIGATTNDGKLSKPFRDRFKMRFVFQPYSLDDSMEIVKFHADRLKVKIEESGAMEIAKRGRGVPRVLVSLLERCRDVLVTAKRDQIDNIVARTTFINLQIDSTGLTLTDIEILKTLYEAGEPVGLENLAVRLNESQKVLSETIEPYLIQRGLIMRGTKGRTITEKGRLYLSDKGHIKPVEEVERYALPPDFDRGL